MTQVAMKAETTSDDLGPAVVDGALVRTSVSAITGFDRTQDGGCERKYHFEKVQGFRVPATRSQKIGTELHAQLESYLKTGEKALSAALMAGFHFIPSPDLYRRGELLVEHKFTPEGRQLVAAGIPLVGFVDVVNKSGLYIDPQGVLTPEQPRVWEALDWKTTKNLKWAKDGEALKKTVQMVGYAKLLFHMAEADKRPLDAVRISHVTFQIQGACKAQKSTALVDRDFVEKRWTEIEGVVRRMIDVAAEKDIENVEPNWNACSAYGGCPFRGRCPAGDSDSAEIAQAVFGGKGTAGKAPASKGGNLIALLKKRASAEQNSNTSESKVEEKVVAETKVETTVATKVETTVETKVEEKPKAGGVLKRFRATAAQTPAAPTADAAPAAEAAPAKEEAPKVVTEVGSAILPPDAPAEGVSGPIADPLPPGVEVSPEIAAAAAEVAPAPAAAEEPKAKKGRGGKKAAAEEPAPMAPPPVAPAPESDGLTIYVNCMPVKGTATNLDTYVNGIVAEVNEQYGCLDPRLSNADELAYNKWKVVLAICSRTKPPAPGVYYLITKDSDLRAAVMEGLQDKATQIVKPIF